ncbi:creatininase family protein [Candidatus Endowatersipora endosymbiont of Watersipora subatra]|uniref:creatininase family protein n=1 Tax=Candidatus Endowatersipora endosymbiont of Watersipora subatra TaxID=3077946 RepID=UPI003C7ED552
MRISSLDTHDSVQNDPSSVIAMLPLGATEQHGKHLPLETDILIADGIASRLCKKAPIDLNVLILPTEPVGYSPEHLDHEGTKSLSYHDAVERWINIGKAAAKKGIRRFVMLNAHGGNSSLMTVIAQELRINYSMLAVSTSWTRFIRNLDVVSSQEHHFGIHGGDIETSVMLALDPEQVDLSQARNFPNLQETLVKKTLFLRAYGPHSFGWKATDLNCEGVTGNAAAATPQKGELLLKSTVDGLLLLLKEVAEFDPDTYFRDP